MSNEWGFAELREEVARGCRVLAGRGLSDGILGHITLRVDQDRVLTRCRGAGERGLGWTTAEDIRLVSLDGKSAADGELDGWSLPNEFPLHSETLRQRPDVRAVVHCHPPDVVAADLAGLALRPILGAFDIPGMVIARGGVPVYPRGVLIRNRELAREMSAALGDRPVVILRAHGLTSTGASVAEAVLRAISVDTLARISLQAAMAGGHPVELSEEDVAELPDLGTGFNRAIAWRHELARIGIQDRES